MVCLEKSSLIQKKLNNFLLPSSIILLNTVLLAAHKNRCPKAYNYMRKTFGKLLPHPRTLRRWYMVVDGNPGFTRESF
ncbi:THAP domain-containing protein 1-like [Aphis craccivora]|uniref:THAP domain-containing protein 1-like n=1 Tax=Aphis craccivora TaxID=307492 RepID=A0A6G0XUM1_APHCR|nr:THAP domain-containing protein 1-like [Aphis craccivora]